MKSWKKSLIIVSGIASFGAYSAWAVTPLLTNSAPTVKESTTMTTKDQINVAPEVSTVDTTVIPAQVSEPAPAVETPPVLSVEEYATKYLNMTDILGRDPWACLNDIVATWPERFTPDVRENNIKALQLWNAGGICSTGMSVSTLRVAVNLPIRSFGANGEYFDSDIAKRYHN